ncbi:peptidase m20 domain-containing protein 2 [Plakobranchus ocellatus]|uniref:Peptidase m20 domain-containing protein 2 n=1 Tax=Plakobranchus ocellatus TaxID=259542 RepID=A0AAV4AIJ0_9GAST|nr:peptidase m20 domain-containing protein 2 [Plakobranchus ocellatus]
METNKSGILRMYEFVIKRSCGLHVVHNSFRHGSEKSGWALGEFLRDLYTLFKKAPARKDDYFNAAGESTPKLSLKFCGHRWLENVPAAERALEIWPFVLLYIKAVRKREASKPSCKSYQTIVEKESDQLFTAKLHSFIFLANILRPFLEKFQKDAPLAPFLVPSLLAVVKRLYSLILTQETVAGIKDAADLSLPKDLPSSSFKKESEISLGHQAELALDKVKTKVSALKIKDLKQSFSACVKEILTRMLQKTPLRATNVKPGCKTQRIALTLRQDESRSRFGVLSPEETRVFPKMYCWTRELLPPVWARP